MLIVSCASFGYLSFGFCISALEMFVSTAWHVFLSFLSVVRAVWFVLSPVFSARNTPGPRFNSKSVETSIRLICYLIWQRTMTFLTVGEMKVRSIEWKRKIKFPIKWIWWRQMNFIAAGSQWCLGCLPMECLPMECLPMGVLENDLPWLWEVLVNRFGHKLGLLLIFVYLFTVLGHL